MPDHSIIFSIFLIFTGAAVLAAVALFARQSLLVAYILLGVIAGPWGLRLVTDASVIQQIGHIGIIFLLFLLGLNLQPSQLVRMFREALLVTVASSLAFCVIGFLLGRAFGFSTFESLIIGAVTMFSSTIIGLKLLPTTALHHRHMGQVMVSILLLQDILAILILVFLEGYSQASIQWQRIGSLALVIPLLIAAAFIIERHVLQPLMRRFDTIQEYVFLTAIGWCLGIAQLAEAAGLSYETGAFIAGVALAANPLSLFIAESFRPLRDFFLIMFFFSLGASFNLTILADIFVPALAIATVVLAIKPLVFAQLLRYSGEQRKLALEAGFRLGQVSEFSLMIAVLALNADAIGSRASYLIQTTTLLTFVASSYLIMLNYPTPIAVNARLRRD
ncbi:MAG: cation:proton antiporter [Pseudomonadota bacterium]